MKPGIIAIVTPWFGKEHTGGAESLAWELSHRLAARGHRVEVLATTSRAFLKDWFHDQLPAGTTVEEGVTVRRFPVDPRDAPAFDAANGELMAASRGAMIPDVPPVPPAAEAAFFAHSIRSAALVEHLRGNQAGIRAVIALPYLYGAVVDAVRALPDRTLFHTCLHDESYAYTATVAEAVRAARRLVFLSAGEADLARRLYGPGILARSRVAGSGVPAPPRSVPALAEALPGLAARLGGSPYLLCLGRRDDTKGVGMLTEAFRGWRHRGGTGFHLVLAGPGQRSYDDQEAGIHDLGLVPEAAKWALLDGCQALLQPSRNESYSRVLMEAWRRDRPVVAHRWCQATALAVEAAGGGWLADEPGSWEVVFTTIRDASPAERARFAAQGRAYAEETSDWDRVLDRFDRIFDEIDGTDLASPLARFTDRHTCSAHTWLPPAAVPAPRRADQRAVHQLLPALAFGDAISNQALTLRELIRSRGFASEIFIQYLDEKVRDQAFHLPEMGSMVRPGDGLIYHHSIGSGATPLAIAHPGAKVLVYHNITPARFFRPYRPDMSALLERGRAELPELVPHFPHAVADSRYNADELSAVGFRDPGVLPLPIDPTMWGFAADPALMRRLSDGRDNVLFVGRVAPNKRQDDLIASFARLLAIRPGTRLVIAGEYLSNDPYYHRCRDLAQGLGDAVLFTNKLGMAELQACYRTASLFASLSEHEGFGVPLMEAMWFDIPVLAYACTAVPETLGPAGCMLEDKDDPAAVAAAMSLLLDDADLRRTLLAAQRRRREDFQLQAVTRAFAASVEPLLLRT